MYVYFSENDQYYDLHDKNALVWQHNDLSYDWNDNNYIEKTVTFAPTEVCSLLFFLHIHKSFYKSFQLNTSF